MPFVEQKSVEDVENIRLVFSIMKFMWLRFWRNWLKSRERERENYERVYGVLDCEIARITVEGTSILISLLSKNILCIRWKKMAL